MNIEQVPLLLAALSQFQFAEASEVAVQMWAEALDDDMTVEFAVSFVAGYYGRATAEKVDALIPGHLNRAWRDERAYEQRRAAIPGRGSESVPMPDYVREALRRALESTPLPDGDPGEA